MQAILNRCASKAPSSFGIQLTNELKLLRRMISDFMSFVKDNSEPCATAKVTAVRFESRDKGFIGCDHDFLLAKTGIGTVDIVPMVDSISDCAGLQMSKLSVLYSGQLDPANSPVYFRKPTLNSFDTVSKFLNMLWCLQT